MMALFTTKTIEEVTDTLIDYRGKTPKKTNSGIKLITAKVIKGGTIIDGNHEYIAENNYEIWMRRGLPKQWDILITTEAPLGEVAQLRTSERVALAQRVILLRGKQEVINQGYYFQAMKSPFVQAELKARATGTTVLGIKQSELRQVRIPYFPLITQNKIAAILSAYDDLIENNTRRIKILEEMAQALYREWFVKFRYPGHEKVKMVESERGMGPEGWEVNKLKDICSLINYGYTASAQKEAIGPKFLRITDIVPYLIDWDSVPYCGITEEKLIKYKLEEGDIVIARTGATTGYAKRINKNHPKTVFASYLVRLRISPEFSNRLFGLVIESEEYKNFIKSNLGGSAQPHANAQILTSMPILVPSKGIQIFFDKIISDFMDNREVLQKKNINLRRTQNLLLPKLVSGELDIAERNISMESLVV